MTKISRYVIDDKVTGSDKWIGSDAQTQYTTKNFTPTKLAVYFNENQVIDIGTPIRYRYDILEFGDTRLPGTITFNPQVGTPYNLSSISSFILSKYTLKGNDVTQYLNFLIGSNVLIYKADDINIFGLYKVVSLVENIDEPDFFDVVVSYTTGNGSIVEDKDYLVSLIDIPGGDIPTKTSDLINDGEDGVHPFITAADVTPQVNSDWDATSGVAEILNKPIIPTKTSDLTNDGEDGINPFITLEDIPTPNLNDVLLEGNISELDAKIGELYLFDTSTGAYAKMSVSDQFFALDRAGGGTMLAVDNGSNLVLNNGIAAAQINNNLLVSRNYTLPDASGTIALTSDIPTQGLTSVGLTMPVAFNIANSPLTSDGTIAVSAAGTSSQYIRGDGQLATLPSGGGGGSSVFYYLNGSIAASVATYKQLSNTAIIGGGTDFTLTGNGLITQFLTDVGNPNRIEIPGGAWNFEMWFSMSSNGGTPKFYVELLKYNGTTFTTIANSSAVPETINGGTGIDLYLTSLAVPTTTLLLTDRLAIRVYIVNNSGGRTAKLHTENSHLCQIITTFASGIAALNGLTSNNQYLAVDTSGTDFNISSVSETHTFNLPTASATNRGALSTTDWTAFNGKFNLPSLTTGSVLFSNGTTIAQDNANFFWDDTNKRLSIGNLNVGSTLSPSNVVTSFYSSGENKVRLFSSAQITDSLQLYTNGGAYGSAYGEFGFLFKNTSTQMASINFDTRAGIAAPFRFFVNPTGASAIDAMDIFRTGEVGIGTSNTNRGGKLQIKAPGALSTDIALRVRNSADSADLLVTNGLGNVGIGTAGSTEKLTVWNDTAASLGIHTNRENAGDLAILRFSTVTNGDADARKKGAIFFKANGTGNGRGDMQFAVNNAADSSNAGVANAVMTLQTGGNVGIGTATPLTRLHVTSPANAVTGFVNLLSNSISFFGGYTGSFENYGLAHYNTATQVVMQSTFNSTSVPLAINKLGGNVIIGDNADNGGKLQVKAPGALSTDIALKVRNSADSADLLSVAGTGNIIANGQLTISGAINGGQYYPNTSTQINTIYGGRPDAAASGIAFNTITPAQTIMLINYLGNVLIGTTTNIPSSKLTVQSTTQGFLPPRMTNAQRIAIVTPAVGLMVYCTDVVEGLYINKSTGWTFII